MKRAGLFGGTFNPIHLGHLRAAQEVAEALDLERVVFVPSAIPPHKSPAHTREGAETIAPAEDRLRWVELAVADNPRLSVDAIEVERSGPSYSVDTLRSLPESWGRIAPVFLIGADAFVEIDSWREPAALLKLTCFAVLGRPPDRNPKLADLLPQGLRGEFDFHPDGETAQHRSADTWIRTVTTTALDISSTDIRKRLRAGRSVRYLVPETARQAILASGVYSPKEAS